MKLQSLSSIRGAIERESIPTSARAKDSLQKITPLASIAKPKRLQRLGELLSC
jgi:hypothetical protein